MKFGEKYELLESLTTGTIETFAANDKVRGERVLVHIVECTPQKSDQSTSEWVLESFRRLAPQPPGPILETGKYSGTHYAYVVTRPADEAAVKSWVRRYEMQSQETKESSVHRMPPASVEPAPTAPFVAPSAAPSEPRPVPGQMTQLLRDYDSLMKSRSASESAPPAPQPPARQINLAGESGLHAPAPSDPASIKAATPPKESGAEPFSLPVKPVVPDIPAGPPKEGPKPGEFTSFFQGPFRGDSPAEVPGFASEPIEPPRKNVGEFTALFGQAAPPQQMSSAPAGSKVSATGFTGLFRDMVKPQQAVNPSAPGTGAVVPGPAEPFPAAPVPQDPSWPPQAPIFVAPPAPVITERPISIPPPLPSARQGPPIPSAPPGDGATGAFLRPASEAVPAPVAPPAGPSPYTQIISRSKIQGAEEGSIAGGQSPAAPAAAGSFPPLPKIPPPPIPRIPPPPPMPKMAAPKAPAAPKMPKLDAAPPPPVSYWPLIITLTVLFFLAALLVLYFVLKH